QAGRSFELPRLKQDELVEIYGRGRLQLLFVFDSCEFEELGDEILQPAELTERLRANSANCGGIRRLGFEQRTRRGDRCPQLVARVGDELAFTGYGRLEAIKHLVECLGQPVELVPGARGV